MSGFPIRWRLTVWYASALLLGLAAFGLLTWFALEQRLLAGVDARLEERVNGLRTVLEIEAGLRDRPQLQVELAEFAREVPDGALMALWDPAGAPLLASTLLPQPAGAGFATLTLNGRPHRLLRASLSYAGQLYTAHVAAPLDDVRSTLALLRDLLLLLTPLVLAASGLGGYWLSRRALAPVDEMTAEARSIGVENLSRRLPVPPSGDEIARLAVTWNAMLGRLEGAVGRIRQFTADASHELRTPLALIRTTAELSLRREREPADYREALRQVQVQSERMTELIEALLEMARADASADLMPLSPTNLNDLVESVAESSRNHAEERSVRLATELPGEPSIARANAAGLRRVLLILVDNALRHTSAGGAVRLVLAVAEEGFELSVSDNGSGIAPEALPHVFERFYQADAARSGGGSGLGLSIAQSIAAAHGARIEVSSSRGAGSRFWIRLKRGGEKA